MLRPTLAGSGLALLLSALFLTAPNPAEAQPTRAAEQDRSARQYAIDRIWWNRESHIEKIELTTEQRQQMDQLLEGFLEVRNSEARMAPVREFRAALSSGDTDKARELIAPATEAYNAPMTAQMKLSVDVVELLTEGQLKLIHENYPDLLKRPWVRMMSARGGPSQSEAGRLKPTRAAYRR